MTDPRFARFRTGLPAPGSGYSELPNDGMCLSAYLVLESPTRPGEILVGRIDPSGPWEEIGALDPKRAEAIAAQWMLPASHLRLFEGPEEAARRILASQLGVELPVLPPPRIVSEAYARPQSPDRDPHWDLQFIYRATWPIDGTPTHPAWRELRFVDVTTVPVGDFARGHGDILALAGLPPGG